MIEVSIQTDQYLLVFDVLLSKDFIDTDRGVKVEDVSEAQKLEVFSLDSHERVELTKPEHTKLFEEYAEEAENEALEHL